MVLVALGRVREGTIWPNSAYIRKMEGLKWSFPFQEHYLLSSLSTRESWSTFYSSFRSISSKTNIFEFSCSKCLCSALCQFQCQYYQIHDPRAWSYVTGNIYSTKGYAEGFGKMRYSNSMVVLTQPVVFEQIRKRSYLPWGWLKRSSRHSQSTKSCRLPLPSWHLAAEHMHFQAFALQSEQQAHKSPKISVVHLTMQQRVDD